MFSRSCCPAGPKDSRSCTQSGGPNNIGPCCQHDSIAVGRAPPGPGKSGFCCQQNLIALARSVSFKIRVCNWPRVNWLTQKNLIESFFSNVFFLILEDPSFFIFFSWLLTHFKVHYINT